MARAKLNQPPLGVELLETRFLLAYSFTKIADTHDFPVVTGDPAINDQGEVAFLTIRNDNAMELLISDGQSTQKVIDSSIVGGINPHLTLNDTGTVAFQTEDQSQGKQIRIWNGTEVITLYTTDGSFSDLEAPSLNESGLLGFRALYDSTGEAAYLTGVGTSATTQVNSSGILTNFSYTPSLNNQGVIAFTAEFDSGGSGVFVAHDGLVGTITDTNGSFADFGIPSAIPALNDQGQIAFWAEQDNAESGLFVSDGNTVTKVVDSTGIFAGFSISPALNNQGQIAFKAVLDSDEQGIFTGSDPVKDKVIQTGDAFFGSTVIHLDFSNEGLNDSGQIALYAELADGTSGIYRADPIDPPLTIITQGFQPTGDLPNWPMDMVTSIANRTGALGYAFDWAEFSNTPSSGWSEAAGDQLFAEITAQVLHTDRVRDIHFIGHSRGAVVNSEAIERLAFYRDYIPKLGSSLDQIHVTMLDPHPAHNHTPNLFSTRDVALRILTRQFQRATRDPEVGLWNNIDWSDVYYQHTTNTECPSIYDTTINLWGETPIERAYNFPELTGEACHSTIHDWYQNTITNSQSREGFFWSLAGGGWNQRPEAEKRGTQIPGPFTLEELFNGSFDFQGSEETIHPRHIPGFSGNHFSVAVDGFVRLQARNSRNAVFQHNTAVILPGMNAIELDLQVGSLGLGTGIPRLEVSFIPQIGLGPQGLGQETPIASINLKRLLKKKGSDWVRDYQITLPQAILDTVNGEVGSLKFQLVTPRLKTKLNLDNLRLLKTGTIIIIPPIGEMEESAINSINEKGNPVSVYIGEGRQRLMTKRENNQQSVNQYNANNSRQQQQAEANPKAAAWVDSVLEDWAGNVLGHVFPS